MIHQPKLSLLRLLSRRQLLLCTKSFNKASSSTFHSDIQILSPRESIQANNIFLPQTQLLTSLIVLTRKQDSSLSTASKATSQAMI